MKRQGFTLVEMLIALTIFGMLTAAGGTLLSVTARTQRLRRLLGESGKSASLRLAEPIWPRPRPAGPA